MDSVVNGGREFVTLGLLAVAIPGRGSTSAQRAECWHDVVRSMIPCLASSDRARLSVAWLGSETWG